MTHFADLSTFEGLLLFGPQVLSVGWLAADQPFPRGAVASEHLEKLEQLLVHGWQPVTAKGWQGCDFCGAGSDAPITRLVDGEERVLGADTLWVPGDRVIYVAPSLVIHYVERHGYRPPQVFLDALAACDPLAPSYRNECARLADVEGALRRTRAAIEARRDGT